MRQKIIHIFAIGFLLTSFACQKSLPEKSANEYREAVSAFYIGLAALQVGDDVRAKEKLTEATKLADGEPAAWANLGVLQLRQKDFDGASQSFEKARSIIPDDGRIYSLLALLETQRGSFDKAVAHWQRAIELNPQDFKALYSLALEKERQTDDAAAQGLYEKILAAKPENLAAQLEVARLAAKRGNAETLKKIVAQTALRANAWQAEIKEQFDALQKAANENNLRQAATQVAFLRNVLLRLPEFRQDIAAIKPSDTIIGEPFLRPLKLPAPDFSPAMPDESLAFGREKTAEAKALWAKSVVLSSESLPVIAFANEDEIHVGKIVLPFKARVFSSDGLAAFDYDYDFKTDVAVAGEKGFHLFRQDANENFIDVTAQTKLSNEILSKPYFGVWVLDIELDGDLDLILGSIDGAPVVLQNNGDGSFKEVKAFSDVNQLRSFVWADLDEDGDADAITIDANGQLQFFSNERVGFFKPLNIPSSIGKVAAITVSDINGDGKIDLLALQSDGALLSLNEKLEAKEIVTDDSKFKIQNSKFEDVRIIAADFDNNGANDVLISAEKEARLWVSDKDVKFKQLNQVLNAQIFSTAELTNDGKLDLVGLDIDGKPNRFINQSRKNYHWQIVHTRASQTTGDQRINSFGIGGEIEIRAGLLTQKQIINTPQVHFGLGEQERADVVRVVWGNGYVQAEFELQTNQTVLAEQRLKGSCPHLFAFDGKQFRLVKDAPPWSPALGLKINAQDTFGILQTEEWFKIPGEYLAPKDGFYELRITAELWESYYIDNYSLMVIDHPKDTEIFADERFAVPPPPLKVFTTAKPKPFTSATDDNGNDVSNIVRDLDENYLDNFGRGTYQGVTRDHYVELELPQDAPRDKQLWLVANGWMHPTDASINVALGQSNRTPPQGLSIEVQEENGNWRVAKTGLGFPAGKMKTILLDLTNIFTPNTPRRFRLRTNMEIFWDKLEWATGVSDAKNKTRRLGLSQAELRYRGFSVITKANESSPELPDYYSIATTTQRWRDLEGYYTRFGDIKELLLKVDDRLVLVNAGDEMILRFAALPPLREGWQRDFVFIGNGWIKDGDYNSVFSKTVLPLPTHTTDDYSTMPTRLEDDPVYQKNKADWVKYHTRYVAPDSFRNTLRVK